MQAIIVTTFFSYWIKLIEKQIYFNDIASMW